MNWEPAQPRQKHVPDASSGIKSAHSTSTSTTFASAFVQLRGRPSKHARRQHVLNDELALADGAYSSTPVFDRVFTYPQPCRLPRYPGRNIYYIKKQSDGTWSHSTVISDGSVQVVSFAEDINVSDGSSQEQSLLVAL